MSPAATPPTLPKELQVEVTAACNLRCRMCLVRYRPPVNRVAGSMSLGTFTRLVDQLPGLERVTLQGLGEPLLAPDLVAMVRYATERGAKVGFNTNATLLSRAKAGALIDAGLEWLHVSLDGATSATYEAIRDGAHLDRVATNVVGLMDEKQERRTARPRVQVVFVAQRSNVAELPALVRLVAGWGIDDVRVQNLSHDFSDTDPAGSYQEIRDYTAAEALWHGDRGRAAEAFGEAVDVAAELGVTLRLPDHEGDGGRRRPGQPGCDWPWRSTYVMHDGAVQPCCMIMGVDRATVGHADEGMGAVWHGASLRDLRAQLLTDEPPDVCRGCAMYRQVF
ncbi:MAG: radical SAM protein [Actinomycetota bacterium]|nr:radical SAM protein [Actinomycetota bacterium]